MSNEVISEEELTEQRTPSELLDWVGQKTDQIYYSGDAGRRALRLYNKGPAKELMKKFMDEAIPLAVFGKRKFGDTNQVLLQPVIDDPRYDAVVTDLTADPPTESFVEITLSHEGRDNYLRRCQLLEKGYVFPYAPVVKAKAKKGQAFSIPPEANSVEERVGNELKRILAAAKRKEGKEYRPNTSQIIFFDDAPHFQDVMDNEKLDGFVSRDILSLDLRFSTLYLVGRDVFGEYSLGKKT